MSHGIIADDLTGSCDVGGRLTRLGYCPVVLVGPSGWHRPYTVCIYRKCAGFVPQTRRVCARRGNWAAVAAVPQSGTGILPAATPLRGRLHVSPKAAIVILNTCSRDCSRQEAVSRARAAAQVLERSGFPVVYQKIDSTLRGHWAEALKAVARVTNAKRVLVCPAFPAQGRFIRHGRLCLGRRAWGDLGSSAADQKPINLRAHLRRSCRGNVGLIEMDVLRGGARAVRVAVLGNTVSRCVVFDAEREGDLRAIGRAFRSSTERRLWVGSAGLVVHAIPPSAAREAAGFVLREAPWLLVQGSRQPISREQFRRLEGSPQVRVMHFSPGSKDVRSWRTSAVRELVAGRHVALVPPEVSDPRVATELPHLVSAVLQAVPRNRRLAGIFVAGGNTAEGICELLGITTLRVVKEIRPGIPASVVLDGQQPGLCLVTKAGGFGKPREVRELLERGFRA